MTAQKIRDEFTKFFVKHSHTPLPSSSLVPDNDPTVLLTTAGMQQFKPYFLGEKDPVKELKTKRVTTIQKCFRTSDIEQVGDPSHLTFFEMLGNFSFGDYWKTEAIDLAWEFLTQKLHLPASRLWATVFSGHGTIPRDRVAERAWAKHLPKSRIVAHGRSDNFWGPPGTTGSCGPSSEIHWQLVEQPQGKPGGDNPEFVELWNLVFTEYFQDERGRLSELPKRNIDTGLGLERLAMVVEQKNHVFETDIYQPLIRQLRQLESFGRTSQLDLDRRRERIVADHLRGAVFLLADGVRFSNKDQGYILRRIVRRAADQFLQPEFSLDPLVTILIIHHQRYPELKRQAASIQQQLADELELYRRVLNLDVASLVKKLRKSKPRAQSEVEVLAGPSHANLSADEAFTLYATHGLSLDRLQRLGYIFDQPMVERKIAAHQEISRAGATKKFGGHGLGHGPETSGLSQDQIWQVTRLHTATHLLHAALRQALGTQVRQNGSDITPERLRFDFTFDRKLTDEEKLRVENLVNEKVKADLPVKWEVIPYQQAIDQGALAFFKEKYGDQVKVYTINDFSKELCNGPHVEHTNQVGKFKITAEQSIGRGLRRIKAEVQSP
ncbi:MAG: alanine--tRNA ligase [Candidatus Kerfeldbacteria bacterium]|nr:alanine--tRNA ligase [Candidatus Kerfeldbacteria bacterium]